MTLRDEKCVPCAKGSAPLSEEKSSELGREVPDWTRDRGRLRRKLKFANFVSAMSFLNRVAELAEREGHHPDFCVHYDEVELTLWTHSVGGLSKNDFIVASKIDALL